MFILAFFEWPHAPADMTSSLPSPRTHSPDNHLERNRFPCLDGWRALFCALVLSSHFKDVGDGQLGVRCFFVLSGFLITSLLLSEARRTGTIDMRLFLYRRGLRLLPVYFFFLAVMAAMQIGGAVHISPRDWIGATTFTLNFIVTLNDWTMFHLWSLSIEQQFYLLWPLIFLALAPWIRLRRLLFWTSAVVIFGICFRAASGAVRFWLKPNLGGYGWIFTDTSTFAFIDVLAIGCLGACLLFHFRERLTEAPRWLVTPLSIAACALLVFPSLHFSGQKMLGAAMVLAGHTISALGCAILLVTSVLHPTYWPFRLLNTRPFVLMGAISYSTYLWQQPYAAIWLQDYSENIRLVAAVMTGFASYYLFEKPFLGLRHRLHDLQEGPSLSR